MNKEVWKFPLDPENSVIYMPYNAEILTVQVQNGSPFIWALVTGGSRKEERTFEIYGTGHSIPYNIGVERKYINTFQLYEGDLVFHVFERIN